MGSNPTLSATQLHVRAASLRCHPLTDTISAERRSALMARIRSKDTKPELVVRRLLHGLGYRYVLHDKRLPGSPDLVFPSRRKVIFVHGCFWHGHSCTLASNPKTNTEFWMTKIEGNSRRDKQHRRALVKLGWDVGVVWECSTRRHDLSLLARRLTKFLNAT